MPAACSRSMAVDRIWATSTLVSRSLLLEHGRRLPRGLEREASSIVERVIRLLQVRGESLYREGEPQDRLGELPGAGPFSRTIVTAARASTRVLRTARSRWSAAAA